MYSVVKSVIKHQGSTSDPISSYMGVKQGGASSALLFMMFVNDITVFVNDITEHINTNLEGIFTLNEMKLFLILYADDQVLFSTSPDSLQSMLADIEAYCDRGGLKMNTNKTKVLIFEKGSRYTDRSFYLYNSKLEIVTQFKYLGINFYKNGRWNQTNKYIAEHALKAMQRLFCVFNKYEFSIKDKLKLFDVLVTPVLNYSAEVSGYFESKDIEHVPLNFLRKLLCVNKSTNLSGLCGELGTVPLIIIRKVHMFRYWLKYSN